MTVLPPPIAVESSIGERSGPPGLIGFGHLQIVGSVPQVNTAGEYPGMVLRLKAVPCSRGTKA